MKSKAILKEYFKSQAIPTQEQFTELIDSLQYKITNFSPSNILSIQGETENNTTRVLTINPSNMIEVEGLTKQSPTSGTIKLINDKKMLESFADITRPNYTVGGFSIITNGTSPLSLLASDSDFANVPVGFSILYINCSANSNGKTSIVHGTTIYDSLTNNAPVVVLGIKLTNGSISYNVIVGSVRR